jgi:hypothetical protein
LDLSRKRLDFDALLPDGERFVRGAVPPDADGLLSLVRRLGDANEPVLATIESMSGPLFVHDQLELAGWDVRIADAHKAKGLAPLACKTDKIDSWALAELGRLQLVPEIWLADPAVRAERERARFRLHLGVSSAISPASPRRSSSSATRGCARKSTSRASATGAAPSALPLPQATSSARSAPKTSTASTSRSATT